jgi:PAS domain S-box-containing protein
LPEQLKILMLEDSHTDAELVQRVLKKEEFPAVFHLAMSKRDFIQALDHYRPDVILADNSLPQFDAVEALRIVRQQKEQVPFIMVTGTVSEEFAARIIKEGADDYILKDRLIRLPAAIEAAVRQRQYERDRDQALKNLVESEEKYRSLVDRISDGFLAMDENLNITFINQTAAQLLQSSQELLLGKNLINEFPGAANQPIHRAFQQAMQTGHNIHLEEYSAVMDKWVYGSIYPSATGLSVFFRDITEQRKAEETARISEEKYKIFIQRITDAFIALDKNWCYTYLNKQAGELIQRDPGEMIGKNVWEEFPEAVGSDTYKAFHKAMDEQCYVSNTDYYEPLDLWQENFIYPSENGLSVFIRNITEKKKLEIALQEQQRREQIKLTATALRAQERERNSIAIELHDNVNQILVGTNVMLSVIRDYPDRARELITTCMDNLRSAIEENRKIAHELVSPNLTSETLLRQVYRLCQNMLHPAGLKTSIINENYDEEKLHREQKLAVYRIIQEQCTNIIKYAKASTVIFSLFTTEQFFAMQIGDDGVGMEAASVTEGIGLKNITSRLSVFGGNLQIDTMPGKGFRLNIQIPLSV